MAAGFCKRYPAFRRSKQSFAPTLANTFGDIRRIVLHDPAAHLPVNSGDGVFNFFTFDAVLAVFDVTHQPVLLLAIVRHQDNSKQGADDVSMGANRRTATTEIGWADVRSEPALVTSDTSYGI